MFISTIRRKAREEREKGFTLIETLVSVALFSIVMLVAVGSLVMVVVATQKARAQKIVINNLNSAMESMARAIRDGEEYVITNGGRTLQLTSENGDTITFTLNTTTDLIMRRINSGPWQALTSDNVEMTNLGFSQVAIGDDESPRVQIVMAAVTEGRDNERTEFNLQTTVAERVETVIVGSEPTGGGGAIENPLCQFVAGPGRYLISMETGKYGEDAAYLWSTTPSNGVRTLGPFVPAQTIPAGTYTLRLQSYDDHIDETDPAEGDDFGACYTDGGFIHDTQSSERYHLEISYGGAIGTFSTGITDDIPDEECTTITTFNNVTLPADITSLSAIITAHHDNTFPEPSGQSVVPVCAMFEEVGTGSYEIELEPHIER